MKRFISILFLAISTFLSAQDTTVPIALPITFSKVVEVVYEDFAGTNGRSLSGAFAQAIIQGGTFNPTYEGVKDRLTNFRGYEVSVSPPVEPLILTSTSTLASWSPFIITNPGTTLDWTVSGGVTIAKTTIDDPTFNFSSNTGTANILVENVSALTDFSLPFLSITTIDISEATSLIDLTVSDNLITTLDISTNINLESLNAFTNSFTSIDISNNPNLDLIYLGDNQLSTINISPHVLLNDFRISYNLLTSIDVSTNILITNLSIHFNSLTSLDISNNPLIIFLNCSNNGFSSTITNQLLADLVSHGKSNGTLVYRNNETGQGVTDRAILITRGWGITDTAN